MVGGVIGGGITFVSFKPCCSRLKNVLMDTLLSNPDHVSDSEEDAIVDNIISGSESTDAEISADENMNDPDLKYENEAFTDEHE